MALSSLIVRISADSSNFQREIAATQRSVQRMSEQFKSAGSTLTNAFTLPFAAVSGLALKSFGEMERLQRGMIAVSGSAAAAAVNIQRLQQVAELPGLSFKGAISGSIALQAAGFSAANAERTLKAFGNALAVVGKGSAELDGVITALSQIQSKGRVSAEEINQLAERLPQIRVALKDAFGTADTEAIQKLGFTTEQVLEKITQQFEKMPQVTGGLANSFENLSDRASRSLADVGSAIAPFATKVLDTLDPVIKRIGEAGKAFGSLPDSIQTTTIAIGGIALAAGPISSLVGKLKELEVGALGLAGALSKIGIGAGAGTIGLTALLGGGAILAMMSNLDLLEARWKKFDAELKLLNPAKPKNDFFDIDLGVAKNLGELNAQIKQIPEAFKAAAGSVGNFGITSVRVFQSMQAEVDATLGNLGLKSTATLKKAVAEAEAQFKHLQDLKSRGANVSDADFIRASQQVAEAQKALNIEFEKTPALVAKAFHHPETSLFLEQESRARRKLVDDIISLRDQKQKLLDLENGLSLIEAGAPEMASLQAQAFKAQETAVLSLSAEFGKHVDLMREVRNEGSLVAQMFEATAARTREILAPMKELDAALRGLGLRDLSAQAEKATADFAKVSEAFAEGAINAETLKKAWIGMIKIQDAAGIKIDPETFQLMKELEAETGSSIKVMENSWKSLGKEVKQIVSGMSRGIAETIVQGRSLGDTFKGVAQNISSVIITYAINQGLRKLVEELSEVGGLIGRVGDQLTRVFGSVSVPPSVGKGATDGVNNAANTGGKVASAAAGGIMSSITAVSSAVSAVFDVLQFTQLRRMEQDLGRIEVTTRGQLNQLVSLQGSLNQYLPLLLNTQTLQSIDSGIQKIYEGLGALDFTGGRGGGNIYVQNVEISGAGDPEAVMARFSRKLRLQDRGFAGV